MATETEALEALNQIETELSQALTPEALALQDIKQLCAYYSKVRDLIKNALSLIEKIPVYGAKIATTIRFLIEIADLACSINYTNSL